MMSPQMREILDSGLSTSAAYASMGLDSSHAWKLLNIPGAAGRASIVTQKKVAKAHRALVPGPFSLASLQAAYEKLLEEKAHPGGGELERHLVMLDGFLRYMPNDRLSRLEYIYLDLMKSMSMALHSGGRATWFGGRFGANLRDAEAKADEGIDLANEIIKSAESAAERAHAARIRARLILNRYQIYLEQSENKYANASGRVMSRDDLVDLYRSEDALRKTADLLEEFPFLWQAAYNGLAQASYMHDGVWCLFFWTKLKSLDPGFQDFSYPPRGEVSPINAIAWFSEKYQEMSIPNPSKETTK